MSIFSDTTASSSGDEGSSDESFGFSTKPSDHVIDQNGVFVASDSIPLATTSSISDMPIIDEDSTENDSSVSVAGIKSSDMETTNVDQGVRRSSRRRTLSSKYMDDYISPTISPTMSSVVSPKRSHSPSTTTSYPIPKPPTPARQRRKKAKYSPPNSPNRRQVVSKTQPKLATIGTLQLTWPRFGIRNAIYEGKIYSVTNTCPLDTGLFVLYHAYKAGTKKFCDLFERDDLDAFIAIRRTFQLIESDGWTTARLFWLVLHGLIKDNSQGYVHDIKNTLTEIVFRFVKPMQEHPTRSKCSCTACPKQIRHGTNVDIALT